MKPTCSGEKRRALRLAGSPGGWTDAVRPRQDSFGHDRPDTIRKEGGPAPDGLRIHQTLLDERGHELAILCPEGGQLRDDEVVFVEELSVGW